MIKLLTCNCVSAFSGQYWDELSRFSRIWALLNEIAEQSTDKDEKSVRAAVCHTKLLF